MYLAQRSLTIGYLLASAPPGNRFDPASSGSRRLLNLRDKGSLTDEVRVEVPTGHCQPPVSIFGATVPAVQGVRQREASPRWLYPGR